jgi:hypothetical protein
VGMFLPAVAITPDLTPLPNGQMPRDRIIDAAIAAATQGRGLQADLYDHVFVVAHGSDDFEFGGDGRTFAVVQTTNDLSTMMHEFGHCLGLHHTHGFVSDRAGPGSRSDAYGSNYDVMAVPSSLTLADPAPPSLRDRLIGPATVGPMSARANLHRYKPGLLQSSGLTSEHDVTDSIVSTSLWPSGRGGPGRPELMIAYIDGTRSDPYRQLLVEYRPTGDLTATDPSRWDAGLSGRPWAGDAPGVVVHRINATDGRAENDRPYYVGTISIEGNDHDVEVVFPSGAHLSYMVELTAPLDPDDLAPEHVTVRVGPAHLFPARLRIISESDVTYGTTRVEMRPPPPWMPDLWGPQPWDVTEVRTRWTLAPHTHGVGGLSNLTEPESSYVEWTVDTTPVPTDGTQVALRGGALVAYAAQKTGRLTVYQPTGSADTIIVGASARAADLGAGAHLTASDDLVFEGEAAVPSDSTEKLIHWWELKSRAQRPWDGPVPVIDIARVRAAWRDLARVAPEIARISQPMMDEAETRWRHQLIEVVRSYDHIFGPP